MDRTRLEPIPTKAPIEHAIERGKSKAMTINHIDVTTVKRKGEGMLDFCRIWGYSGQESGDNGTVNQEKLGPYSQ